MKNCLRLFFLYPLSLIFGLIATLRNFLFDKAILKSKKLNLPTICIGNLAVGGTGKTPHTEYILSLFRSEKKTAMLSRGYKRETKGFLLADDNSNARTIGDEPFQIHRKFPDVTVAVCENRFKGINELSKLSPKPELVVLDDAFQHRQVKPGFSILLTDYARRYSSDHYLPFGRLRESKHGSRRADMIVVSKCPDALTNTEMIAIEKELQPCDGQDVFFSAYQYKSLQAVFPSCLNDEALFNLDKELSVLLVAGIVSPEPILDYLNNLVAKTETMFFPDHHQFTKRDFSALWDRFSALSGKRKIILLTEKDAARVFSDLNYPDSLKICTFALPISVKIKGGKENLFIQKIKNYVKENPRNSSVS